VRSEVFRQSVTATTRDAIAAHLRERVESELESTDDAAELERLRHLASVRIAGIQFHRNLLPSLAARLTYELGEIFFTSFLWSVERFSEPVLLLGNDPLLFVSTDGPARSGSFSDLLLRSDPPASLWQPEASFVARARNLVEETDRLVLPIDPTHALILTRFEHLQLPGRYDMPVSLALGYNLLQLLSSREWLCQQPGMDSIRACGQPGGPAVRVPRIISAAEETADQHTA
jgi:hypothetical protein